MKHRSRQLQFSAKQRGAVLYVALIMLILLALIGVVGMQVTGLQERMSANYQNVNLAFQAAEAVTSKTEATIKTTWEAGFVPDALCGLETDFEPTAWSEGLPAGTTEATHTRDITLCVGGQPVDPGESVLPLYQVTAWAIAPDGTSAVIDSIYAP